jgi:hypothetical protein
MPDMWQPTPDAEITLCLEPAGPDADVLRVTRISCWPQRRGYGRTVISALRTHAEHCQLTLEVPDPLEESLAFWAAFAWERAGGPDRTVLRFTPRG